jgi:ubiquinone/menaquinone biosynthesis C-methylase UbiE
MPLLDEFADIILCRNALDHMPHPKEALKQIWRVLNNNGIFYLSVDIGGAPTPDEPSPLTTEILCNLLHDGFKILSQSEDHTL